MHLTRVPDVASAWITKRASRSGPRYLVRYRVGGREAAQLYGGTFKNRREAEQRQLYIAGELAALRVPLLAMDMTPVAVETLAALTARYLATRIDASPNTLRTYRQAMAKFGPLAKREPGSIRAADVQEWITGLSADGLAPATVRKYLDPLRAVLDFAEIAPNPARSPILRLPPMAGEEINPPSYAHVEALVEAIAPRHRLAVRVLAETGLRSIELEALKWGDVDLAGGQLRIARGRTKGRTAGRRWVPLPDALVREIADLLPLEDRDPDASVFPEATNRALGNAMRRACTLAEIPVYTPHDLRHRFVSILVMGGVPLPVVKQVTGHSRASVTLDVYSHVMIDEPADYVAEVRARVVTNFLGDKDKIPVYQGFRF
jgi:integrase